MHGVVPMNGSNLAYWLQWHQVHLPWIWGSIGGAIVAGKAWQVSRGRTKKTANAHWATLRELRKESLGSKDGIVLGGLGKKVIRYNGKGHVIVVASTQSGKSNSVVKPTLLEEQPGKSFLIHDPKGEIGEDTRAYRGTVSKVIYLEPYASTSDHYNPLDTIRLDSKYEYADTKLISEALCNPDGKEARNETERHFFELTSLLLNGVLLYGLRSGRGLSLGAVSALISQPWPNLMTDMKVDNHPIVQKTIQGFARLGDKQYGDILSDIERAIEPYSDPIVAKMVSYSDFHPSELKKGVQPLSLYLSVPFTHMKRLSALTRLFFRQMLDASMEDLDGWDFPLDVIVEERPSLGHLSVLNDGLNHAAGFGVRFVIITPSMEELIAIDGPHHNYLAGTKVQAYFGINDEATAQRVAGRLGKKSIKQSRTTTQHWRKSITHEIVEKPLLSADAILHQSLRKVIVIAGQSQVLLTQMPWYDHKPWKDRGVM